MPLVPWAWVAMVQAVELGGIADGLHLLKAHLLGIDGGAQAHHAAGGHILDQIGAVLDVVAHRLDQLVRAVAHTRGSVHLIVQVGAVMVIGMAAGGGNGCAGCHQTRAPVLAAVDGVPHCLIGKAVAAYHAQGGEAAHQVEVRGLEAAQGPVGNGLKRLLDGGVGLAVHRKMHMAVAQARGDKLSGEVDHLAALQLGFGGGHNGFNAVAVGKDHYMFPDSAGGGIEQFGAFDRFLCHSNTDFLSLVPMNRYIVFVIKKEAQPTEFPVRWSSDFRVWV